MSLEVVMAEKTRDVRVRLGTRELGCDQVAVDNFLASLPRHMTPESRHEAYENARMDRRLYGWSDATMTAIVNGIAATWAP